MKAETIFGIYTYLNGTIDSPAAYYLQYLFHHRGNLDSEVVKKVYTEIIGESIDKSLGVGPFESLEMLNKFSFALMDEFEAPSVGLIADYEYNQVLEEANTDSELLKLQFERAKIIRNPEEENKAGIFRKLFS